MPQRGIDTGVPAVRYSFTDKQKLAIYAKQGGKCAGRDCRKHLDAVWMDGRLGRPFLSIVGGEIHHIKPVLEGGQHRLGNWRLFCHACHMKEHGWVPHA